MRDVPVSRREAEVLAALGERLTNAEIADRLVLSVRTVETHVSALLRKFDVANRRALAEVARARRPAPTPPRLPAPLTSFVGREEELPRLAERLAGARLVTLTGPAGVGKTRLAVELARRAGGFPDGVWFVDLTKAADETGVEAVCAATLDASTEAVRSLRESLLARLAGMRALLLLDNCEHVVDAVARLAADVLAAAPGLRVLTTSREPLALPGEHVLPVRPLPTPEEHPWTDRNPAVELFTERATAVLPSFALDEATTAAVASICRHLDGLPLAIELAAAQTPLLSPQQIDARLGDRFAMLRAPARGRPARHDSLETALEWSIDLLDPGERALLHRLAVFRGRVPIEAIAAVAAGAPVPEDPLAPLGALVRKSLVVVERVGDEHRFRLLESIREYGRRRLAETHELDERRDRHLAWALALMREAGAGLGTAEQPRWLDRLDGSLDDIEEALGWAVADPVRAGAALGPIHGLGPYWLARGRRRAQGVRWSRAAAGAAVGVPARVRVRALVDATLFVTWSDLPAAEALAATASDLAGDDPVARGAAGLAAALLATHRGAPDLGAIREAVDLLDADDPLRLWGLALAALAKGMSGDPGAAADELSAVAERFGAAGDAHLAGGWLSFVGDLHVAAGRLADAARANRRASALAAEFDCASCASQAAATRVLVGPADAPAERLAEARRAVALAHSIGEVWNVLCGLDVTVGALADAQRFPEAAVLGSATAALRARLGYGALLPGRLAALRRGLDAARAALPADAFAELERDGADLDYESAVALALA